MRYILAIASLFIVGCDGGFGNDHGIRGLSEGLIRHEDRAYGVVCYELKEHGAVSCVHRVY